MGDETAGDSHWTRQHAVLLLSPRARVIAPLLATKQALAARCVPSTVVFCASLVSFLTAPQAPRVQHTVSHTLQRSYRPRRASRSQHQGSRSATQTGKISGKRPSSRGVVLHTMARAIQKRKRVARSLLGDFDGVLATPQGHAGADAAKRAQIDSCLDALVARMHESAKERMRAQWGWDVDGDAPAQQSAWLWDECRSGCDAPSYYGSTR